MVWNEKCSQRLSFFEPHGDFSHANESWFKVFDKLIF